MDLTGLLFVCNMTAVNFININYILNLFLSFDCVLESKQVVEIVSAQDSMCLLSV